MAPGQRTYFQNPFEHNSDVTHASIFFVAFMLLVGVAAIIFFGNALPIPSDPTALIPTNLASSLPSGIPGLKPKATPAAASGQAVPASTPATGLAARPSAATSPAATPAPANVRQGAVVNAGATGVFLSRTPNPNDRLIAWPDGTALQLMGEETDVQGTHWVKVTDPRGNVGWVPGQYVQPVT